MINGRHQKVIMFGDQGFYERGILINNVKKYLNCNIIGHNVSFSRSGEEDLVERLDGLISMPQEWHKKKVTYVQMQSNLNSIK